MPCGSSRSVSAMPCAPRSSHRSGAARQRGWCCPSAGCRITSSTSTCRETPTSRSVAKWAFTFPNGSAGAVNAAISGITGGTSPALNFLYTPAGVIAAEVTFFTPFVVRPLLASFAVLPRAQLDIAASLGASPLRVLRSVVMPEAWPALMAGGSLVLLLTLNEFGIVLFTGAKGVITLPVLIYTRGIVTFDLPGAAVIATVQIALSLSLYIIYRVVFARVMTGRGKGDTDVVVEPAK